MRGGEGIELAACSGEVPAKVHLTLYPPRIIHATHHTKRRMLGTHMLHHMNDAWLGTCM